ncbi:lysM domain receptor-like kinase 4 [Arachis duranensis]|uniref:LysM domain receptor-like kinase 4 n=1 Tax=Arachis duranensis TaxID=130453 RepID=A0A6P4CJ77_ARADU|nr:lysM domain receptor-like kinase 4 [Arachis duranensis]
MIHLCFVSLISISVCYAQQYYDPNSCNLNETISGSRYTCNSTNHSCKTFLVYKANKNFQTISNISALFHMQTHDVLELNNLTSSSDVLEEGKEVLVPINCSCIGQFYQFNSFTYRVTHNTTFYDVACQVFEGLLSPVTLSEENVPLGNKPDSGFEIKIPLRCACVDDVISSMMKVKYLVTYPVVLGDDPGKLTKKFGVSGDDFYAANGLKDWATIFPKTSVLIPIRDVPIKIFDVQDSPSPPPGFLPTTPVVEAGETTQGSDLYIAGPLIGFGLLIALLASGLYVKSLKKWKNDAVVPSSDSNSTNLICSTTGSSPMYMETSRRCSTASWLTPDLLAEIKYCLVNYTIEEIEKATKNFSDENKIGDLAYKGLLNNLEEVMVKRMRFEDTGQVIDLHSKINHFNIVELLGVCYGSESKVSSSPSWSYLIFELPRNGCLRECLSDPCNNLNWYKRIQIAFDIATCLYYLHCCAFPSYAHMNVNSRNIFITSKWRGKLADVGRALAIKSTPQKRNNDSIELVKGWVAPEYLLNRTVSEKVDIFAFGVVLLELISGRDNFDEKTAKDSLGFLLGEASEGGCFEGLRSFMDPNLKDYDLPEALCLSFLAKDCVADDPMYRPTMDDIMKVLSKMV